MTTNASPASRALTCAGSNTASAEQSSSTVVSRTIRTGIQDLLIAFPAASGGQAPQDRVRSLQIYASACADFEPFVAERALQKLLFHNPRNPFPPTAQDLFESCKEIENEFRLAVLEFYLGKGAWHPPASPSHLGFPPGDTHCVVPERLTVSWIRSQIAIDEHLPHWRRFRPEELSNDRIHRIPREAFPPGYLERLEKRRSALSKTPRPASGAASDVKE